MLLLKSPEVVQETALRWKRESRIAFVPTMGCLHEGHLKLVAKARELAEKVIVSIFVNPLQFAPGEDFERYPRPFEEDQAALERMGVDSLFHPSVADLYPDGFSTRVAVGDLSRHFCGISRPGHFEGVVTVCLKLFQITQADFAVFGEKDFQQLQIIRKMTADLNLPLTVVAHPTVREEDGLAMSSRNRYLTPEERQNALALPEALKRMRAISRSHPDTSVADMVATAKTALEKAGLAIDYLAVASSRDLVPAVGSTPIGQVAEPRALAAVKIGKTRLIDNVRLGSLDE